MKSGAYLPHLLSADRATLYVFASNLPVCSSQWSSMLSTWRSIKAECEWSSVPGSIIPGTRYEVLRRVRVPIGELFMYVTEYLVQDSKAVLDLVAEPLTPNSSNTIISYSSSTAEVRVPQSIIRVFGPMKNPRSTTRRYELPLGFGILPCFARLRCEA